MFARYAIFAQCDRSPSVSGRLSMNARQRWIDFAATSSGTVATTFALRVALIMANVATGIVVARTLAPTGRGEQAAMVLWPSVLSPLFALGLPIAVNFNLRRNPDRQGEFLTTGVVLAGSLGLCATLVGVIFIPHWIGKYGQPIVMFAQWMMVFAPVAILSMVLQTTLEARGDFTSSNLSKSMPQFGTLILLGVLVLFGRLTPFSAALAYNAPLVFVPVTLAWKLREVFTLRMDHFGRSAKRLLSYGLRSYVVDLVGTFSGQIDQVLVVGLLSAAGLGIYTVALSVSRLLSIFYSSLNIVLFPKAASLDVPDVVVLTARAARISSMFTAAAAIGLIIILPVVMPIMYGGAFKAVVPVARILSCEIVFTGATWILAQAFMATGRPAIVAGLQVFGLLLTIPLMLVLIPRFGLSGAALALLLSSVSRLAMTVACFPLVLKSAVPQLVVARNDFVYLLSRFRRAA
jgi:O-antigen/teichoic acid export membrane protein